MSTLLDRLQAAGCTLALDADDKLLVESDTPLTEEQRDYIRTHKERLIAEIVSIGRLSEPILRCGGRRWNYQCGKWH